MPSPVGYIDIGYRLSIYRYIDIDKAFLKNIGINIDIDKEILENINIDIDKSILEDIDIDKFILENIDMDKDILGKKSTFSADFSLFSCFFL